MIAIIDYGVGNLFSLECSIRAVGHEPVITSDPQKIKQADHLLLPGVGAFADAAEKLKESGLDLLVKEQAKAGKPLLGICLGMQLLLDKSYEYGEHEGLGLIKGNVRALKDIVSQDLKIPQIGWNAISIQQKSPLLKDIKDGDCVYFVHSYYAADCDENVLATTDYSAKITAAIANNNVYGCQFHPEKSAKTGLKILKAFCEL